MSRAADLTGSRFGRLTVTHLSWVSLDRARYWACRCDCGGRVEAQTSNLRAGHTLSCGCFRSEYMRRTRTVHGNTRNDGFRSPEYNSWTGMLNRCHCPTAPGYVNYGARGITVCARWRASFESFLSDMGRKPSPGHSIDRINNNGNYEPANCRWATRSQQQNNRRPPSEWRRKAAS